jgi:4-amino-4-deoxy-L-arabinose transferase-like glycosyltransferase
VSPRVVTGAIRQLRGSTHARIAAVLVLLALAVRVAGAIGAAGEPLPFDAQDFDRHARSIASGHGYPEAVHARGGPSALRPPAFPLLLSGAYALRGGVDAPPGWREYFAPGYRIDQGSVDAGRLLQALIGTAVAALVGLIAFQLFGRRVGLVALAVAAVYPPSIVLGLTLLSDPLFVMFELAALAAALRARAAGTHTLRWALGAGLLAGLAWLTRSNGYVLLLPLALLVWTARPRLRWRALAAPAAVVLAAIVVIAPWTVRNAVVMDALIPVSDNDGYTLAGTYNESARTDADFHGGWRPAQADPAYARLVATTTGELDQSRTLGRAARRFIADHPGYVAEVGACNSLRLAFLAWLACGDSGDVTLGYRGEEMVGHVVAWGAVAGFAVVAALALLGAFTRAARAAPRAVWLVPVVLWSAVFVLAANRFRAPLEPFLIVLAALALVAAFDRLTARLHLRA